MSSEELKNEVRAHMKNELRIMLMVLKLPQKDVKEFLKWYKSNPYTQGIKELRKGVEQRTDTEFRE